MFKLSSRRFTAAVLAAGTLLAAPAFANTFTFETAEPIAEGKVVAEGAVWVCEGTVCTGELDRKTVTARVCKKVAKKAGLITSFVNEDGEGLDEADLEKCAKAARK